MAQFHAWACEAAQASIALDVPKKAALPYSLQGPGCLAKSALSCLVWLASGYQTKEVWLASGWLLAGFLVGHPPAWKIVLTWLKLAGPPRCLGAALWRHCPSHNRSKVDGTIPRVGLRSSPGVDRLGRPEKGCTSLTPCKVQAALPNQPSLAWFGWLLAIKKKGLVGFWLDSTRGLAKQPRGVDRLGRPEKGCASLTPCKAQPCQISWFGWLLAIKKRGEWLLAGFWLAFWLDIPLAETGWTSPLPGGGLVEALPLPQTKQSRWHNSTRGLAKQPRRRSPWTSRKRLHFLNSQQGPGCLAKSALSCLVWLASGYQKKRFGWLLAGFWLAFWLDPCLEKSRTYLAETGWTSPLPGGGLVEALPLPQTKQSRWNNSTHGLAKQLRRRSPWTSRKRLHFLNSLQGPGCLAKSALSCLVWLASGYQKKEVWLASGWLLAGWLDIPLPGKISYLLG